MAAPTNGADFIGKAAYWGLLTSASGTGLASLLIQSADFTPEANAAEIMNGQQTVGMAFANQKQTLTIEGVVSASTLAGTVTEVAKTPKPGAVITVADADDAELTATNSAKYVCIEANKKKSNTDMVRMTIKMVQFVDADISTTVS